jgi:hypothetical protein
MELAIQCIEEHEYLEEKDAQIEMQQIYQENCKYCGQNADKYLLCQNCITNYKEEILNKTGFGVGLIIGSFLSFLTTGSFPVILGFGFGCGTLVCKFSNLLF